MTSAAFAQPVGYYLPKEYQSQNLRTKKSTVLRRRAKLKKPVSRRAKIRSAKLRRAKLKRAKLKKQSIPTARIETKPSKPAFRKYTEKLSFNYFAQFLGPSLSSDYQPGATYNRFKTGQDYVSLYYDGVSNLK